MGLELILPIGIFLISLGLFMAFEKAWAGVIIIFAVTAFIAWQFKTTLYTIEGNTLYIQSGFLYNSSVSINSISKITETNNLFSSPAASLDRLALTYNQFDAVMISPKDKQEFIKHLLQINPAIEVVYKGKQKEQTR